MRNRLHQWTRKHRLWSAVAALLGLFVLMAAVVIGADQLEKRYALRADYSFNSITSQSDITDRVLMGLTRDVHVYALYSPGQEDRQLIGLLERYAAANEHFTFSVENIARNPTLLRSISSDLQDSPVGNDSLIMHCPDTDRIRILTGGDFIAQGYDMESDVFYAAGLNYEKSLTEAVLYVSSDRMPTLQILSGHGELGQADTAEMEALLSRFNYGIKRVQLSRGETLDAAFPLLILSPTKDLADTELKQLDQYARAGGAIMITWDYDKVEPLPNFEAFYRGYGFERRPGMVVAQDNATGSYYNYPAILLPYMQSTEQTAGLVDAQQTMTIMPGAISFKEPEESNRDLVWQAVLKSGPAYIHMSEGLSEDIVQKPEDETGEFVLAMLSNRAFEDGSRSRGFISGSSAPFIDGWMYANTYSAELLLNIIDYLDAGETIQLAIAPKDAVRPPMNIRTPWLVTLMLLLPPVTVLIAALVVLLPRRRL